VRQSSISRESSGLPNTESHNSETRLPPHKLAPHTQAALIACLGTTKDELDQFRNESSSEGLSFAALTTAAKIAMVANQSFPSYPPLVCSLQYACQTRTQRAFRQIVRQLTPN
jgi:hypothetical protein